MRPFDGGRFFSYVLFNRQRHLEGGFQVLSALTLVGVGWSLNDYILMGLGIFLLVLVVPTSIKVRSVIAQCPVPVGPGLGGLSNSDLAEIEIRLEGWLPTAKEEAKLNLLEQVVDGVTARPPGLGMSALLFLLYLSPLMLAVSALVVLVLGSPVFY